MTTFLTLNQCLAAVVAIIAIFLIWKTLVLSSPSAKCDGKILISARGESDEIDKMIAELREISAKHGATVQVTADGNIEIGQISMGLIGELGTVKLANGAVDVEISLIED